MNAFRTLSFLLLGVMASAGAGEPAHDTTVMIDGRPVLPAHGSVTGLWVFAEDAGAQLAMMGHPPRQAVATLEEGRRITIRVPLNSSLQSKPLIDTKLLEGAHPDVAVRLEPVEGATILTIEVFAPNGPAAVQLHTPRIVAGGQVAPFAFDPRRRGYPESGPVACSPPLHPALEQAIIEWDWRMQDGIATPREPLSFAEAIETLLERGERLVDDLSRAAADLRGTAGSLEIAGRRLPKIEGKPTGGRRPVGDSLAKSASPAARDRLEQSAGQHRPAGVRQARAIDHVASAHAVLRLHGPAGRRRVRAGRAGRSMRVRRLTGDLPEGSYLHPEVSYDGRTIYFAFCECDSAAESWGDPDAADRHYHLYAVRADGTESRCLTDGAYDDFSPTCLPDGKLLFISTRRGGFHRCGRGPCYVYTLARGRGRRLESASDFVPRDQRVGPGRAARRPRDLHAVGLRRPQRGLLPAALDGAAGRQRRADLLRQQHVQPGRHVGGPAGARLDQGDGHRRAAPRDDGRLDHPAGRAPRRRRPGGHHAADARRPVPRGGNRLAHGIPVDKPTRFDDRSTKAGGRSLVAVDAVRTKSPSRSSVGRATATARPIRCPRSTSWRPTASIGCAASRARIVPTCSGCTCAMPSATRSCCIAIRTSRASGRCRCVPGPSRRCCGCRRAGRKARRSEPEGTFFLQERPRELAASCRTSRSARCASSRCCRRPRRTPTQPRVGAANASPGKQVLGTVPVERDGSAYFRVPAGTPVLFQALDARGPRGADDAVADLPPARRTGVVRRLPRAAHQHACPSRAEPWRSPRQPSAIAPGPDGSRPLSYPILVQPVLDRHCVECHNAEKPEGKVVLTGEPAGQFSRSYNALIPLVAYTAWGNPARQLRAADGARPVRRPGEQAHEAARSRATTT